MSLNETQKYELVLTTDLISDINQKPIQKKKSIDFYKVLNANSFPGFDRQEYEIPATLCCGTNNIYFRSTQT